MDCGPSRKRQRDTKGKDARESFTSWMDGKIQNTTIQNWLEKVWLVMERFEEEDDGDIFES
ncbi:hypothetical protein KI387_027089, partial [Taxus chinensis]